MFPKSRDFDYRKLFSDDSDLGRFFKPELLEFLVIITTSTRGMSDAKLTTVRGNDLSIYILTVAI